MRSRRKLLLFIIVAAVMVPLVAIGIYWTIPPKPAITLENFRRLHGGMTQEQVEAILGSKGKTTETRYADKGTFSTVRWQGNEGAIWITFVIYPSGYPAEGEFTKEDAISERLAAKPEGVVAMLRRWLGW
jgi:hypothetical protein